MSLCLNALVSKDECSVHQVFYHSFGFKPLPRFTPPPQIRSQRDMCLHSCDLVAVTNSKPTRHVFAFVRPCCCNIFQKGGRVCPQRKLETKGNWKSLSWVWPDKRHVTSNFFRYTWARALSWVWPENSGGMISNCVSWKNFLDDGRSSLLRSLILQSQKTCELR